MVSVLGVVLSLLCAAGTVAAAHAAGRRAGKRLTVPWRPIFQLVDHRTRCLGQQRARVQQDLGSRLPIPPWAWEELFAMRRPLDRRSGRPGPARSGT
jgi:hypothetical protein